MKKDNLKKIASKVSSGDASPEERMIFLKETKKIVDEIHNDLSSLK